MSTQQTYEQLKAKYPRIDAFLLKKWIRLFDIFFDRNASDDITNQDFFLVLRQARNIYGMQSEQAKFARDAMDKLWGGLKKEADKNRDEKISIDEWITDLSTGSKTKQTPWFQEYMQFMFKLFDVSSDNVLDIAEYTDGMSCYGYEEAQAHAAFNAFCPPVKGKLVTVDWKSFSALWLDYFFSTDRAAPGNQLFGVLPDEF